MNLSSFELSVDILDVHAVSYLIYLLFTGIFGCCTTMYPAMLQSYVPTVQNTENSTVLPKIK
jgi:hypothetical protein